MLDEFFTSVAVKCGVTRTFRAYQRFIFNIITVIAVKKWPHIQEEITNEYEFQQLLYGWIKKLIGHKDRRAICK